MTAQSNTLASYHSLKTVTDTQTRLILKCLSETRVSLDCPFVSTCPGCDPAFSCQHPDTPSAGLSSSWCKMLTADTFKKRRQTMWDV